MKQDSHVDFCIYRKLIYDKAVIKCIEENINNLMNYVGKADDHLEKIAGFLLLVS